MEQNEADMLKMSDVEAVAAFVRLESCEYLKIPLSKCEQVSECFFLCEQQSDVCFPFTCRVEQNQCFAGEKLTW